VIAITEGERTPLPNDIKEVRELRLPKDLSLFDVGVAFLSEEQAVSARLGQQGPKSPGHEQ
jgi:hypothetical protein